MRTLRKIFGKTLKYCISNVTIRDMTDVGKIKKFLREQRLRWLGHMKRTDNERTQVKAKNFLVDRSKKGTPKKRWKEFMKKDILARELKIGDI